MCRAVVAADALSSPRTHGQRHGRGCTHMSSGLGDEREQEGELTGKRRPRECREEGTGRKTTVGALCSHGRSAASVGEEADGGGEGSRGTETSRASCWTRSRARSRREEEVPKHKRPLDAATAHRAHAQ